MKKRLLRNGQKVQDASQSVQMTIDSKCPKKWAFVDMETGDIWVHHSRRRRKCPFIFILADEAAVSCLTNILLKDERYAGEEAERGSL